MKAMNKLLPLILILFAAPCFAEVEGAFGIKLGENFDLDIANKFDVEIDKKDLIKNYSVNAPIIVEPFKKVRVYVGVNTNIVIGIKGSGDIKAIDENEFDYCIKELERIARILEEKYQIKFTSPREVIINKRKERYGPRVRKIVETTSNKKEVDIKLSCKSETETSSYGTSTDIYIEYWDNNSMAFEKVEHEKMRTKKIKEAL